MQKHHSLSTGILWSFRAQKLTSISVNCEKSVEEFGKKSEGQFKNYRRWCLSIALQSCNAKVLSKKISRQVKNIDCIRDAYSLRFCFR